MNSNVKAARKIRGWKRQAGIALLLSIFVLLLVSVVGIAMLSASGTEVSLSGNYRSSTAVYYAAVSGLEEARGKLLHRSSPNYLTPYLPAPGTTLALGNVIYILNPLPLETVAPTTLGNPATYPDTEYQIEYPAFNPPSTVQTVTAPASLAGSPNALYKWVRLAALTEQSLQVDVNDSNPNQDVYNQNQLIYFDGTNLTRTPTQYQALGVTALAALPDGSRKLLQYIVGPVTLQIPVAAALTLAGPGTTANLATFNPPPGATSFYVKGTDQCSPKVLPAVGVTNADDNTSVSQQLGSPHPNRDHYTGAGGSTPNVLELSSATLTNSVVDMADPISVSNFLPVVQNSADVVLNGARTEADMPAAMSASNPMTIYVNGDLSLTSFSPGGYGLLIVRGNLSYTGDSSWHGIVIVLGGTMQEDGSLDGGEFDGAVYVLNLIASGGGGVALGQPAYIVANPGGKGIYYNSCWVTASQKSISYKVLSFHEIPYP